MPVSRSFLKATLASLALRAVPPLRRVYAERQVYKSQVLALQSESASGAVSARQTGTGSFRPNHWLVPHASVGEGTSYDDKELVRRIVAAYRRATETRLRLGQSMWTTIFSQHQAPLHDALASGDTTRTARLLRDPGASNIFFGIDGLLALYLRDMQNDQARVNHALACLGGLARLAEAIGVLPVFIPEQLYPGGTPAWTADEILARVEQALDMPLPFPNPFPTEHGTASRRGIVSVRAPQSIYQAWRIRQTVTDVKGARLLELGAGLGRTPYYARLFGIRDYTVIDLPIMNAIQAYFLARVLGEEHVLLYGEPAADSGSRIKIMPPSEFLGAGPASSYDLILNADSLTEMDPAMARAYWSRFEASTKRFISINHEGNPFTVGELIRGSPRVAHYERFPYWMRLGYVEERVTFV
jgi:hypothetical protein